MELDKVGVRLEYAMGLAGLDRHELSELLEIHYETLGRYIRDNKLPKKLADQERIANAIGINLAWLRTGEGEMLVGNLPRREYVTDKTPTGESSKPRIGTPGSGMYNPESVRIITQNTEEDMTYDPSLVVPMLLSAYAAVMNRDDLERARLFKETGKRFRVRLTVEEDDPRTSEEPPTHTAK